MNTQNIPDTAKKAANIAGKTVIVLLGLLIVYSVGAQASSTTQPLTPQAQRSYEANRIALCESEKTLTQSKIKDYSENLIELTPDELKRLAEKRDQDCAKLFEEAK